MNSYFDPFYPAILIGIGLLSWVTAGQNRRIRWMLLSLVAMTWVYATPCVSIVVDRALQRAYLPGSQPSPDEAVAIVVLAGDGVTPNAYQTRAFLGVHTTVRLEKAYDIALRYPDLPIAVTGGYLYGAAPSITMAKMMRTWLLRRGIAEDRIIAEEAATSTYESALYVSEQVCAGGASILLVTEMVHIPRSAFAFAAQGCNPIPVPCSVLRSNDLNLYDFLPSGLGLRGTQAVVHEIGGLVWYWFSGKI